MDNEQFQEFVVKHLLKLNDDVSTLKSDVSTLKEDMSTIKSDVSTLKEDVSTLKEDVSTLKEDVSTLKNTVRKIETRMENEIIDKINVLFDSDKIQADRLDHHEQRLNRLSG